MEAGEASRTYRTRRSLRIAVALAALFWAGMVVAVLRLPGGRTLPTAGAAGFAAFFAWAYLLYARTWIAVGPRGLVASTLRGRRPVPFEDILEIVVRDGLAGRVVAVLTRRGLVHFTSLLERHRELLETLLDRTALAPRRV
jgi:hypothetical protein